MRGDVQTGGGSREDRPPPGPGLPGAQGRSGVKDGPRNEMKGSLDGYSWNGALALPTDNLLLFRWKTEQGLTLGQRAGPADSLKRTRILS